MPDLLHPGDTFPALTLNLPGGSTASLPGALEGHFGVVLVYRGAWCPFCKAQLLAFRRAQDTFDELGVKVVALSVDDEATTSALVERFKLTFPVGHSADVRAVADLTGAFVNPEPEYLQTTGFLLDPRGRVVVAVYSNGAIGGSCPRTSRGWSAT